MAVSWVAVFPVVIPFLEVAFFADSVGEQAAEGLFHFCCQLVVLVQFFGCQDGVGHTFSHDGYVCESAVECCSVVSVGGDV